MTELSFLLDLLLNHKLSKETKEKISTRLRQVEDKLNDRVIDAEVTQLKLDIHQLEAMNTTSVPQAASTLALMAKHQIASPPAAASMPVQVAQTPAALAAMESRNRAIQESISGKINKAEGKPRKF